MAKRKALIYTIIIAITITLITTNIINKKIAEAIITTITSTIIITFITFEQRAVIVEKIILIAIISTISTIGRIIFTSIPSVQPTTYIITMTGIIFGCEMGFITGALAALTSNLFLGQGPWTIWQMFTWGTIGLLAGLFSKKLKKHKILLIIYGLTTGILFGWIMNMWFLTSSTHTELTIQTLIAACIISFPMDILHSIANTALIILLSDKTIKILERIGKKYGLKKTGEVTKKLYTIQFMD